MDSDASSLSNFSLISHASQNVDWFLKLTLRPFDFIDKVGCKLFVIVEFSFAKTLPSRRPGFEEIISSLLNAALWLPYSLTAAQTLSPLAASMKRTCKSILKITVFIFHWAKYENISLSVWIYSLNSKIAEYIDNTSQEYKTRSEDLLKFLNWDNIATRRDKMLCFLMYDIISLWLLILYTKKCHNI